MSLYVDIKYLRLVSHKLDLFKAKSDNTFNCRCPICGDSKTKKNKARGYFYPVKNDLQYKCHNCGVSMMFATFLKTVDSIQYSEYIIENFGERVHRSNSNVELAYSESHDRLVKKNPNLLDELMPRLSELPLDNEAVVFCRNRGIPETCFDYLYYIDDVKRIEQLSERYANKIQTHEPRLVLPFYDHKLQLSGITCRALRGESLRYLTIKIKENVPLIFGLDRLNTKKPILVVEGPIDSLFLDNCIAVGGTAFGKVHELGLPDVTVIFDNQPRNAEVCKLMQAVINRDVKVVVWPQKYEQYKDINDMVLANLDVKKLVKQNTYAGLEAKLKFTAWKRC
jgi:hypothetical protein